jgi:hypothetical protein
MTQIVLKDFANQDRACKNFSQYYFSSLLCHISDLSMMLGNACLFIIYISFYLRPRQNTFIEDQPKIVKLTEEPRFYSKRPSLTSPPLSSSSQRSVSTFESGSYERVPLRNKLNTTDMTLTDQEEEEGYNTGSTQEKVRFSHVDIK